MRGYNYNNVRQLKPTPLIGERIIAAASYMTAGLVGFIWIILSHISGKTLKPFVKFHAFQSIFISILLYVAQLIVSIFISVLSFIPFINKLVLALVFYIAQMPVVMKMSLLHLAIFGIAVYLIATSLLGRFSELPWVSDTIKKMI